MRPQARRLRKTLWGVLFVQLLVLVTGFGVWTWLDFSDAEIEARKEIENSSIVLEEHVLRSLSAIDGALLQTAALVHEIGLKDLTSETTWRRLHSIANGLPRSGAIFIYDLNGDTVAASTSNPAPVFNASDREYFQHLVALKSDRYIGKALKGQTIHQFFFPVARSIRAEDGRVLAVAQVGVEVNYIAALFTKAKLREKAFGLYLLSDGVLVARDPMTEQLLDECIATRPFFPALVAETASWTGWVDEKRGRQLATARRVNGLPLLLTASMPHEEVFGHAYHRLVWQGAGLLAAIGVLISLGVLLLKSVSREDRIQNALRDVLQRYELVMEGAQSGIWDWDIPRRKVVFSPLWKNMRGFAEGEISDNEEEWSRRIHPEDMPRVTAALQAHFNGKTPVFNEEYRVQRKDGSWMWVADRGIARRDATGTVVRMAGSETDITERKRVEENLRSAKHQLETEKLHLEAVIKALPVGLIVTDEKGGVLLTNNMDESIWGKRPETSGIDDYAQYKAWWADTGEAVEPHEWASAQAVQKGRSVIGQVLKIRRFDGRFAYIHNSAVPIKNNHGHLIGSAVAIQDITELRTAQEALEVMNTTLEQRVAERSALAESRAKQLQALAIELIETEERERRQFAHLLHEDLQQMLAVAKMQVHSVTATLSNEQMLSSIASILEEAIAKSRRLSHELSPPILHQAGLFSALQWLGRQMQENFGLDIELELNTDLLLERTPQKVFLFRAVQELLFNITKHAGVKHAKVAVSATKDSIVVTVSDKGRGFDPQVIQESTGKPAFGLLTINERARYIGGTFSIESAPGQGSRFTLTVPNAAAGGCEDPYNDASVLEVLDKHSIGIQSEKGGTRVLFADDHHVMRQGLIRLVASQPEIRIAGEAANGLQAIELARKLQPDVIVMDISMPEMDGIEATRRIKAELPKVRIIGLTMHDDPQLIASMQQAGAEVTLSKTTSAAVLVKAIYGDHF